MLIIPLDHSNLINVIPKEEEIIYSTLTNLFALNMIFTGVHTIITSKSFAFIRQYPNKKLENYPHIEFKYGKKLNKRGFLQRIPLYELDSCFYDKGKKSATIILSKNLGFGTFLFVKNKEKETKEDYKKRSKEFPLKILPYIISSKKEHLKEMELNPEKYKSKEINKLKKTIEKWSKSLEEAG